MSAEPCVIGCCDCPTPCSPKPPRVPADDNARRLAWFTDDELAEELRRRKDGIR